MWVREGRPKRWQHDLRGRKVEEAGAAAAAAANPDPMENGTKEK